MQASKRRRKRKGVRLQREGACRCPVVEVCAMAYFGSLGRHRAGRGPPCPSTPPLFRSFVAQQKRKTRLGIPSQPEHAQAVSVVFSTSPNFRRCTLLSLNPRSRTASPADCCRRLLNPSHIPLTPILFPFSRSAQLIITTLQHHCPLEQSRRSTSTSNLRLHRPTQVSTLRSQLSLARSVTLSALSRALLSRLQLVGPSL